VDCNAEIKNFTLSSFCNLKKNSGKETSRNLPSSTMCCTNYHALNGKRPTPRACADHADEHFVFQCILVQPFAKPTSEKECAFMTCKNF